MSQLAELQTESGAAARLPWPLSLPVAILVALFGLEFAAILALGEGRFSYTLDDPYIHLAVAEEILRGGYGVNAGEFAAPASSILWPFLLAPFAPFDWQPFVPLALNLAAAIGCALVLRCVIDLGLDRREPVLRAAAPILLILASSLVPVAFTGMEHVLQTWLCLLALLGALRVNGGARAPWWLWPALALAPLLRYESLALVLPVSALLFLRGHRKEAALTLAATGCVLAGFAALLMQHGLPPLPSSVLSKAAHFSHEDSILEALPVLIGNQFRKGEGCLLLILCAALLAAALRAPAHRGMAAALCCASLLHLLFGVTWTAFGRYELYILVADLAFLAMLAAPRLAELGRLFGAAAMLAVLLLLVTPLWPQAIYRHTVLPIAGDNIGAQQREMRRFATGFAGGPVAVNDLGWVAYRNEAYVLDLWGLAYDEARRRRLAGTPGWAAELLARHDVALMMIYESWLGSEVPPDWVPLGELVLTRRRAAPAQAEVAFYARPDRAPELAAAARRFAAGLPPGSTFRFPD